MEKRKIRLSEEEKKILKEKIKKSIIIENLNKFFTTSGAQSSVYRDIVDYFNKKWIKKWMIWYEYKPRSGKDKWKLIENLIYKWRLVGFAWRTYKIENWKLYKRNEVWDM